VLEEYFRGFDRARLHDLRSASKTFVSVLLGAAMLNGARLSPETPVYALFAAQGPFANPDPRKAAITVGELMTHSSGLACDDNDDDSPGNEDRMQEQAAQPDWFRYVLDLPLVHQPGEVYAYCSGGMNLAGGALRAATGVWLPELFDSLVARPLQIRRYAVNLMPTGEGYSGGGMHLRPRDLLKVGVAYLNGGVWNGVRVVSRAWVERSTAFQMASGNGSSDGYGWHRNTLEAGGRTYQEYEANGNGGQLLIVLPELDLALVFTAGSYGNYRVWRKLREEIVPHQIIPAVTGP
jgi:CubicO group peptidase (beta-lactamase class C family)